MKILTLILFTLLSLVATAQTLITDGEFETQGSDPSSVLEIASQRAGLLIPRMTREKRDAIQQPTEGLLVFNLDESCLNAFASGGWQSYCMIRYSTTCQCIEYLSHYGSNEEEWIAIVSNGSGEDWLNPHTELPPTDINDDRYTLGKTFLGQSSSLIDVSAQLSVFAQPELVDDGVYINLESDESSLPIKLSTLRLVQDISVGGYFKAGIHSAIRGQNDATIFGLYNLIDHSGDGAKYSIYNSYPSEGNGHLTSMYNIFSNNGTGDKRGLHNHFSDNNSGTNYGVFSEFLGHSSLLNSGAYNIFNNTSDNPDYGTFNSFESLNTGKSYGMYNDFKSTVSSSLYGAYNRFSQSSTGIMAGIFNEFESNVAITSYGSWNKFAPTTSGIKAGVYNEFPNTTEAGLVYGLFNTITNDSPQTKYGVCNSIIDISDGKAFGVRSDIIATAANSNNLYGTYNTVSGGTGTNYAGYFATNGAGNMAVYAENTSNDGYAGVFNGDVEIGEGFLAVGEHAQGLNNLDGSMQRYGIWEIEIGNESPIDFENIFPQNWLLCDNFDGYKYLDLGVMTLPEQVTGAVFVTKVIMESRFIAINPEAETGLWIGFLDKNYTGLEGWMGEKYNGFGTHTHKDYEFTSMSLAYPIEENQNIRLRLLDEITGDEGGIKLLDLKIKVYYKYTTNLKDGDFAASGLIYSNTSSQVGDLAEYFEVDKEADVENGLIVSFKTGSENEYEIAQIPYSDHIVGVISENPSVVLNNPTVGPPVALAGRVKVKLSQDSGILIQSGDYLTTSSTPGKAMIARRPGRVIGYAVTNQKLGEDTVEILVQPGFHWPKEFQGVLDGM